MPLRGKDQIVREFRVAEECLYTQNDVTVMELKVFTSNSEVLGLECRGTGQLLVDDAVEFFARVI